MKDFINDLIFEDASTILSKTYKWLKERDDIKDFGINVKMKNSQVDAYVIFLNGEKLIFTMFEGK